ncbi:Protein aardvark (Suppressor of amiB protein 16) [Durusdinium trenchii]|uniref:Protein aardvark (Suppressor of amiB protein 16) n=1 Tax=Durusdinium trenchii TaxID=1381693 RepID=A0ABP0HCS8_9DINO
MDVVTGALELTGELARNKVFALRAARLAKDVELLKSGEALLASANERTMRDALQVMELVNDLLERVMIDSKRGWRAELAMTARALRYKAALESAEQQLEHVLRTLDSDGFNALLKSEREKTEEDEKDGLVATRVLRECTGRDDAGEGVRDFHDAINGIKDAEIPELLAKVGPVRNAFEKLYNTLESEAMADEATIDPRHVEMHEDEILGTGSFGEILGATWRPDGKKRSEKKVAVKRIPKRARGTTDMVEAQENLRREARLWKTLQSFGNRFILKLEAICIKGGKLVLVMERCDMSLHELLHEQDKVSLEPGRIEVIVHGIARGIAFLHSKGVIHRNIKPRNVLFSQDTGNVKLCDFRLCTSRFVGATRGATTTVQGSVAHMAPEVLTEPALWSSLADIFAFGVTCWEILHRKEPWSDPGMNRMSVVHAVENLGERPSFDENLNVIVPPKWMKHLITSAWSQDASMRPKAAEVVAKLDSKRGWSRRSTSVAKNLLPVRKMPGSGSTTSRLSSVPGVVSDADEVRRLVAVDSHDEAVAAAALDKLGDLLETDALFSEDKPTNALRVAAHDAGAVARCAAVLDLLGDSPRVAAAACKVLRFVGWENGDRKDSNAFVEDAGVARLVLGALSAHPDSADVRRWTCGTLLMLALKEDGKAELVRLGAVEDIVSAMRVHRDNAAVQEHACGALVDVVKKEENKVKLIRLGAAKDILAASCKHSGSVAVQDCLCKLLEVLTANRDGNGKKLTRLGALEDILAVMRNHRDSAAVQEAACEALRNLAVNDHTQAKLMGLWAVVDILAAMRKHRGSPAVQIAACEALHNLAVKVDNKVELMRLGAASDILAAMREHRQCAGLQEVAFVALCNLGINMDIGQQEKQMQLGMAEDILAAMRNHRHNETVQLYACEALVMLSDNNADNQMKLIHAVEHILAAMRNHCDSAAVQTFACKALWSLAMNLKNNVKLMQLGTAEDILVAMRGHHDSAAVIRDACGVLRHLALKDDSSVQLVQLGAAEDVLAAMGNHRDNVDVHELACGVLGQMAMNKGGRVELELMRLGAGKAILAGMRKHRNNAAVQGSSCEALCNLAAKDKYRAQVGKIGAAEDILTAMRNHRHCAWLQISACNALMNLGSLGHDFNVKLVRLGAAKDIRATMRNHRDISEVQTRACHAMASLVDNVNSVVKVIRLGAAEDVLAAMRNHCYCANVQEAACNALLNLTMSKGSVAHLMRLEVMDDILAAMRNHSDSAEVQQHACGVLMNIAINIDFKGELFPVAAEDVLAAMRNHRNSATVQESACGALRNLAANVQDQEKLVQHRGGEDVLAAMRNHRDSVTVQAYACGALHNLAMAVGNKLKLAQLGAVEVILAAMRNHRDSAVVQECACGALSSLALNGGPNGAAIRAKGAGELTLEALRRHGSVEPTVHRAVMLTGLLAEDDKEFYLRMEAKGMRHEMEQAKRRFPSLAGAVGDFLTLHDVK